ncbi:sigma-70 family RNA polymerase sigma factor [Microlunatus elymi]|uniref:Sigma-70 family RNA polymerase sigma factor n=1 Tax=Microlunatus elymi TaxID=2596828 RepID=A0A516PYG6_9ACTN|nr:sigma-70 family RNA polymerase sigma factor [Microlunatus elymi]QDP96216.1 sigma-70 family RNA polymerase sigma factor [Microlunatus elymi]
MSDDTRSATLSIMDEIGLALPPASLTAADESQLAQEIEAGLLAGEARASGGRSDATEAELIMLERLGQQSVRRLIESNLRLVALVIRRDAGRSRVGNNELFQEGCLGLIEAVRRFDHRRGLRFATYALHWIRAYVGALSATRGGGLNLPYSQAERARELRGLQTHLSQQLGRLASTTEVATAVGRDVEWVEWMLSHTPITLLAEQDLSVLELPDDRAAEEFESVLRTDLPGRELLVGLNELERRVIELRYGFTDGSEHNTSEVARRLGVSRARARRCELRALERLRAVYPQQASAHLYS